jgi:hypothetical protein
MPRDGQMEKKDCHVGENVTKDAVIEVCKDDKNRMLYNIGRL